MQIYCLMSGYSLTDELASALFFGAVSLMRTGKQRQKFVSVVADGIITTKGERASLGVASGQVFTATYDTDIGQRSTRYVVRDAEADGVALNDLMMVPFSIDVASGTIKVDEKRAVPVRDMVQ